MTFSVTIWAWTSPLSPLSCIPLIRLLSILLWFIETEKKRYVFIESFLWVKDIYGHIRATAWIFLLALLQRYAVCSLKLNFLSIINPSRLSQLAFSIEQSSNGSFAFMSKLESTYLAFPCSYAFFTKIFKSFTETTSNLFSTPYLFFLIL